MVLRYYRTATWLAGAQAVLALFLTITFLTGLTDSGIPDMNRWLPIAFSIQGLGTTLSWWLIRNNSLYDSNPCSTQERALLFSVSGSVTFFYLFLAVFVHVGLGLFTMSSAILLIDVWALLAVTTFVLLVIAHQFPPPHVVPEPRPRPAEVMRQVVSTLRQQPVRPEYLGDIPGGEANALPESSAQPEAHLPDANLTIPVVDEASPGGSRFDPPADSLPLMP